MRTRFHKIWCRTCQTMQFQGECGHSQRPTLMVVPSPSDQVQSLTGADAFGLELARFKREQRGGVLVLPEVAKATEYFFGEGNQLIPVVPFGAPEVLPGEIEAAVKFARENPR